MRLFLLGHRRELLQPLLPSLFFLRRPRPTVDGIDDVLGRKFGVAEFPVRDRQRSAIAVDSGDAFVSLGSPTLHLHENLTTDHFENGAIAKHPGKLERRHFDSDRLQTFAFKQELS